MSKSVWIGCLVFIMGMKVFASPYIEPTLRGFIDGENGSEKSRLLVTFQRTKNFDQRAGHNLLMKSLSEKHNWLPNANLEPLWIINGVFLDATKSELAELIKENPVKGIYWASRPIRMPPPLTGASVEPRSFTYGLEKIGVPALRKMKSNLQGQGIRVGILDTGIKDTHPDLKGRLKVYRNFSPANETTPADGFGHGTHVAGTIAGGHTSGLAIGVAPQVDLIVGRIFDGRGNSEREMILKAMQWMADPDGDPVTQDFAQVVNSSWSDDEPYADRDPKDEPFCQIIDEWVKIGMIPVFSAGNTGPKEGTINIPAGCPNAFAVGATERNDRSPVFSSTGPAVWKSLKIMKPEVSAPGMNIKSAYIYGGYTEYSGTSMSAPHVSGAFALLLQAQPGKSAQEYMQMMSKGAKDLGDPGQDALFGHGRIDINESLK